MLKQSDIPNSIKTKKYPKQTSRKLLAIKENYSSKSILVVIHHCYYSTFPAIVNSCILLQKI